MTQERDEAFMREALAEARLAEAKGEVPVGAVVVINDEIIARGHNLRQTTQDPTAHAELVAVREAGATKTLYTIGSDPRLNHRYECVAGVLADECASALREFFGRLRKPTRSGSTSGESPS